MRDRTMVAGARMTVGQLKDVTITCRLNAEVAIDEVLKDFPGVVSDHIDGVKPVIQRVVQESLSRW